MNQPITRRDLAERGMDALDPARHDTINVTGLGVKFASALEVMDFSKLMSTADKAIPPHLRGNPGACLRIVFQAIEWNMSPWAVADKSYVVNDRLAYESQLIHAVIEARAPLRERLNCTYDGEGDSRTCTVIGHFRDGTTRDYTTPPLARIRKNSPLWKDDPDQQLWYYGSRSWSRKWCSDVISGLYTPDELRENPKLGRPEEDPATGLRARLVGNTVNREEGHQGAEHVRQEVGGDPRQIKLATLKLPARASGILASNGVETLGDLAALTEAQLLRFEGFGRKTLDEVKVVMAEHGLGLAAWPGSEDSESPAPSPGTAGPQEARPAQEAPQAAGAASPVAPPTEPVPPPPPRSPDEWAAYCRAWIATATDPKAIRERWSKERSLRNACGVVEEQRQPIMEAMVARCRELGEGTDAATTSAK